MVSIDKINKTLVLKGKIKEQCNGFLFWQSQPFEIRLATIEKLRQEYNTWKYGSEQGFQRVYRIVKRLPKNQENPVNPESSDDSNNP